VQKEQELLASIPRRLVEVSQKEGWTTLCIDICLIKLFFLSTFFIKNFVSKGSRILSPGVHENTHEQLHEREHVQYIDVDVFMDIDADMGKDINRLIAEKVRILFV
jgi:hypothetical protein